MASRKQRKLTQAARRQESELRKVIGKAPAEFNIECAGVGLVEFIEAADSDGEPQLKRFKMLAYTGGTLNLMFWPYPVIIDLTGLKIKGKSQPILRDHDYQLIVGHSDNVEVGTARVRVEGVMSGVSDSAAEVIATSANGFPWQASVGCSVAPPYGQVAFVDEGAKVTVNGKSFTGPCYVARKSMLKEISFVALGADDNTIANVAASAFFPLEDRTMKTFEEWVQAMGLDPETISAEQRTELQAAYDKITAEATPATPPAAPPAITTPPATATPPVQAAAPQPAGPDLMAELRAEHTRLNAINAFAALQFPGIGPEEMATIKAKAVQENWTADATELAMVRASRPTAPAVGGFGRVQGTAENQTMLCAALAAAGGIEDKSRVKIYGEKACEQADSLRGIGLQEFLVLAAAAGGVDPNSIPRFRSDAQGFLRAAFSTVSVPTILNNTANKLLLEGYNYTDQTWRAIAATKPVNDFKAHTRVRLTADAKYEKLGPAGEITHGVLDENSFSQQIDTMARMFAITRQDIINDDLGVFDSLRSVLGMGAGDAINDTFWTLLLSNPSSFFSAGNSNYVTGLAYALSIAGLDKLEETMLNQKKPAVGKETKPSPLGVRPKVLLVPHQLASTARGLHKSTDVRDTTANTKYPTANIWAGQFGEDNGTLVISPFIGNSAFTGNSATAFYMFADPQVLPAIEVAFLNGNDAPTVESSDADFNTLGIQLRGYHDFGVAMQDPKGAVKSKGIA